MSTPTNTGFWYFLLTQWFFDISGALPELVPFVQYLKSENNPWRSINFSKIAGFNL